MSSSEEKIKVASRKLMSALLREYFILQKLTDMKLSWEDDKSRKREMTNTTSNFELYIYIDENTSIVLS